MCSSINFAMQKTKPGTLTAAIVKNNLKGTVERFLASRNTFLFISLVKGTSVYWKQFLYDGIIVAIGINYIFPDVIMCWPKMTRT